MILSILAGTWNSRLPPLVQAVRISLKSLDLNKMHEVSELGEEMSTNILTPTPLEKLRSTHQRYGGTAETLRNIFQRLGADDTTPVTKIKFIKTVRTDNVVADFFNLPTKIHQEDGSRDLMEVVFQALDADGNREISWKEFTRAYGFYNELPFQPKVEPTAATRSSAMPKENPPKVEPTAATRSSATPKQNPPKADAQPDMGSALSPGTRVQLQDMGVLSGEFGIVAEVDVSRQYYIVNLESKKDQRVRVRFQQVIRANPKPPPQTKSEPKTDQRVYTSAATKSTACCKGDACHNKTCCPGYFKTWMRFCMKMKG